MQQIYAQTHIDMSLMFTTISLSSIFAIKVR